MNEPRRPIMIGNWKMNLGGPEAVIQAQRFHRSLRLSLQNTAEVVMLPPFTAIAGIQAALIELDGPFAYGAQDLAPFDDGAYTGDISGSMLHDWGCTYVLVGHSERRVHHHESDGVVNAKVHAAIRHELRPILCVGEGLQVRQEEAHIDFTVAQLQAALAGVHREELRAVLIAYEPVWAIGTGHVARAADAQEVCAALRARLSDLYGSDLANTVRILYGGSVNPSNAAAIANQPDVDGALVGTASLDADDFAEICRQWTKKSV